MYELTLNGTQFGAKFDINEHIYIELNPINDKEKDWSYHRCHGSRYNS